MSGSTDATGRAGKAGKDPRSVGTFSTVLFSVYFILLVLAMIYALVRFWPGGEANNRTATDFDLLWIVAVAGALGSTIHALRSYFWYVGHGELKWRWLLMYVLLPFVGASLGLVFYLVIRGGFFSPSAAGSGQEANPYGFAAVAALVGLFSGPAVEKLKDIADTIFTKPKHGDDYVPPKDTKDDPETKGGSDSGIPK